MLANAPLTFLLASPDHNLLARLEPAMSNLGSRIEIRPSADTALAAMTGSISPALVLLDTNLPGMETERLLAGIRRGTSPTLFPVVLIADTVTQQSLELISEGTIDDLIPRSAEAAYWSFRLSLVLRAHRMTHELFAIRQAGALNVQLDHLTGVFNREAMVGLLFRETDRAQRMSNPLSLLLFDVDDFGHWNSRLGSRACDELLRQVASRSANLLRSYDLLGRHSEDTFLAALPGCSTASAESLAQRIRNEVFYKPFRVAGDSIRLSACFGISSSHGRSPLVVLCEAENALASAKTTGPESICCFGTSARSAPCPAPAVSTSAGNKLLA